MRRLAVCLAVALCGCGGGDPTVRGDGGADAAAGDAGPDGARDGAVDAGNLCSAAGIPGVCLPAAACTGTPMAHFCGGGLTCCLPKQTDGGFMCDEAAHPLPNEGLVEEPGEGGCPAGMPRVDHVLRRPLRGLAGRSCDGTRPWSPYFNPGSTRACAPCAYAARCRRATSPVPGRRPRAPRPGKRLCTDTEWLRACQGPTGTTYPYGAHAPARRLQRRARGAPGGRVLLRHERHVDLQPRSTTRASTSCRCSVDRTGERAAASTAEGAFDMMGNLHEWTADPAGTFRGGYYVDTVINGNGCLYATTAHDRSRTGTTRRAFAAAPIRDAGRVANPGRTG